MIAIARDSSTLSYKGIDHPPISRYHSSYSTPEQEQEHIMKGLDSPLSAAVASVLSEVAWCSGTFTAPKDDLRVYYGCPTDTDPHAARLV